MAQAYEVIMGGIDYPISKEGEPRIEKRAEVGAIIDDLPADDIRWLMDLGYIKKVSASTPTAPARGE